MLRNKELVVSQVANPDAILLTTTRTTTYTEAFNDLDHARTVFDRRALRGFGKTFASLVAGGAGVFMGGNVVQSSSGETRDALIGYGVGVVSAGFSMLAAKHYIDNSILSAEQSTEVGKQLDEITPIELDSE